MDAIMHCCSQLASEETLLLLGALALFSSALASYAYDRGNACFAVSGLCLLGATIDLDLKIFSRGLTRAAMASDSKLIAMVALLDLTIIWLPLPVILAKRPNCRTSLLVYCGFTLAYGFLIAFVANLDRFGFEPLLDWKERRIACSIFVSAITHFLSSIGLYCETKDVDLAPMIVSEKGSDLV